MANDVLYEVRITSDFDGNPKTVVFRSDCILEQAVQLANSLWLSTNNENIQVSVCENSGSVPVVIYHSRS